MSESLKLKRASKGYTQEKMSEKLGITKEYYNMIENDKRTPSVSVAKEIGKLLGIKCTTFYDDKKSNG